MERAGWSHSVPIQLLQAFLTYVVKKYHMETKGGKLRCELKFITKNQESQQSNNYFLDNRLNYCAHSFTGADTDVNILSNHNM